MPIESHNIHLQNLSGEFSMSKGTFKLIIGERTVETNTLPCSLQTEEKDKTIFSGCLDATQIHAESLSCASASIESTHELCTIHGNVETPGVTSDHVKCTMTAAANCKAAKVHSTNLIIQKVNHHNCNLSDLEAHTINANTTYSKSFNIEDCNAHDMHSKELCTSFVSAHQSVLQNTKVSSINTTNLTLNGLSFPPMQSAHLRCLTATDFGLEWLPLQRKIEDIDLPLQNQSCNDDTTFFKGSLKLYDLITSNCTATKANTQNLKLSTIHVKHATIQQTTGKIISRNVIVTPENIHLDCSDIHNTLPFKHQRNTDKTEFLTATKSNSLKCDNMCCDYITCTDLKTDLTNTLNCSELHAKFITNVHIRTHSTNEASVKYSDGKLVLFDKVYQLPFRMQTCDTHKTYFSDVRFDDLIANTITAKQIDTVKTVSLNASLCSSIDAILGKWCKCDKLFFMKKEVPDFEEGVLSLKGDPSDEKCFFTWSRTQTNVSLHRTLDIQSSTPISVTLPCRNQSYHADKSNFNGHLNLEALQSHTALCSKTHAKQSQAELACAFLKCNKAHVKFAEIHANFINQVNPQIDCTIMNGMLHVNKHTVTLPIINQSVNENHTFFEGNLNMHTMQSENVVSEMTSASTNANTVQSKTIHSHSIQAHQSTCSELNCGDLTIGTLHIPHYTKGILHCDSKNYEWQSPRLSVNGSKLKINQNVTIDTKLPFHCALNTHTDLSKYIIKCDLLTSASLSARTCNCKQLTAAILDHKTFSCTTINAHTKNSHVTAEKVNLNGHKLPLPIAGTLCFKNGALSWSSTK